MKPKPFSPLNHFTVPCAMFSAPCRLGSALCGARPATAASACVLVTLTVATASFLRACRTRTPKLDDLLHLTGKLRDSFRYCPGFFRRTGLSSRRRGLRGAELGQTGGGGPAHVMRPTDLLQSPDHAGGKVDLPSLHAVACAGGVRVVQVVPGLAHGQDRERPHVGRLALCGERALTDHVADRVDRP